VRDVRPEGAFGLVQRACPWGFIFYTFFLGGTEMEEKGRSSTGLDENVAGFFCYLFGFITGIVFLVVEKESRFVKFHAMQSTITFLSLFVISIILGWIPIIGLLVYPLWILSLILWLLLMIKALRGERYSLPIVGKMAEEKTS
jgi:uncharacterized membrane protein